MTEFTITKDPVDLDSLARSMVKQVQAARCAMADTSPVYLMWETTQHAIGNCGWTPSVEPTGRVMGGRVALVSGHRVQKMADRGYNNKRELTTFNRATPNQAFNVVRAELRQLPILAIPVRKA